MFNLIKTGKRLLRSRGWEIHLADSDRSLREPLRVLVPYLGINCVPEVGTGAGEYARFLRKNGYTGHIISFEPVEASFRPLVGRCERDARLLALIRSRPGQS